MQFTLSIIVSAPESFPVDYRGFVFVCQWNVALRSLTIVHFGLKSKLASNTRRKVVVKIKTLDLELEVILRKLYGTRLTAEHCLEHD